MCADGQAVTPGISGEDDGGRGSIARSPLATLGWSGFCCALGPTHRCRGASFSPVQGVIDARSPCVIRLLVEAGADLEAQGRYGLSAPDLAARWADLDSTVEKGAVLLHRLAQPVPGGGVL
jgi:hypothetical protein